MLSRDNHLDNHVISGQLSQDHVISGNYLKTIMLPWHNQVISGSLSLNKAMIVTKIV